MMRVAAGVFAVILGLALSGARPAGAVEDDRLAPFLGIFEGQSGVPASGAFVPLWTKPARFPISLTRDEDELVIEVGDREPVVMRFIPVSERLYLLRTDQGGPVKESGLAWLDRDALTVERAIERPGQPASGMRLVLAFDDGHRRLTAYAKDGAAAPIMVLDTALKGEED
jgi:hypothetical protein